MNVVKEIPLLDGRVVLVDDEDYDRLAKYRWRVSRLGYVVTEIYMHREVMGLGYRGRRRAGVSEVDHKNRNKFDNRRNNLRVATCAQNTANQSIRSNSSTGFKGVTLEQRKGRQPWYRARICVSYKRIDLGRFKTAEEAGRAYDRAARNAFGEFACLNFPEDP